MTSHLPLIIEPEELVPLLSDNDSPNLLIIDLSQAQTYAQIHVPGAIHVSPSELSIGTPPAPGKLPTKEKLEALFSRIGYHPEQHIVVYDDEGGGWAGRFIWMLDVIGHKHYSYLNGGTHAWYKEGFPPSDTPAVPTPSDVKLSIDRSPTADLNAVLSSIDDDSILIWDARSAKEFAGTKITAKRNGHIPGAINLDWLEVMDKERNMRLLPLESLEAKLASLGVEKTHHLITHCQSHHRSGLTYLAAKALGYPVQAYDGSWIEWGNLDTTPIQSNT